MADETAAPVKTDHNAGDQTDPKGDSKPDAKPETAAPVKGGKSRKGDAESAGPLLKTPDGKMPGKGSKIFGVSLKDQPSLLVRANSKEEAVETYKAYMGIIDSDHPFLAAEATG